MGGLRVRDLSKSYGGVLAVDGLTMDFEKGTLTTLLGPSGCGKTTTLRCIAGLETPEGGEILMDDSVLFSGSVNVPPERRAVGMVFQSYAIWPHMTVFQNIAFPLRIRHASTQEIDERVKRAMELVRLTALGDRPATQVSGGQQQRVALARALVFDPEVLLLDEPLSNLDASLRDAVRVELREIQRSLGITTVYVTHDQTEALSISDKVVVLRGGRVMAAGTPREVYTSPPNGFVASFVGKANLVPGVLSKREGLRAVVRTPLGEMRCRLGDGSPLGEGDQVLVAIKPENVVVIPPAVSSPSSSSQANSFPGRVELTSYFGSSAEVIISTGVKGGGEGERGTDGRQSVRATTAPDGPSFRDGQEVLVTFPEERCSVIGREKEKEEGEGAPAPTAAGSPGPS